MVFCELAIILFHLFCLFVIFSIILVTHVYPVCYCPSLASVHQDGINIAVGGFSFRLDGEVIYLYLQVLFSGNLFFAWVFLDETVPSTP